MKKTALIALAVAALASESHAFPVAEVVYTQPDILAFGTPVVDGDAGIMAADRSVTPNRFCFFNGGDTDDGDGDSVWRVTPNGTNHTVRTSLGTGNDIEAAIVAVGGNITNISIRGMAVSPTNGNVFLVLDPNGDSAAYVVRMTGSATEVVAGGNSGTNGVDGTGDIEIIGTTVYLLQRAANSAAADQIVSIDGTVAAGITQTPVVVANLMNAFSATQAPSALALLNNTTLLVSDSGTGTASDSIGQVVLPAGTFSIYKTSASIVSEVGNSYTDIGFRTGGLEADPSTGDVYLQAGSTFTTPAAPGDFIVRLAGGTKTASLYITEAQTQGQVGLLGGTGVLYNNSFGMAFYHTTTPNADWLYVSNDNSAGDGIFRVAAPGLPQSSIDDWTLYN